MSKISLKRAQAAFVGRENLVTTDSSAIEHQTGTIIEMSNHDERLPEFRTVIGPEMGTIEERIRGYFSGTKLAGNSELISFTATTAREVHGKQLKIAREYVEIGELLLGLQERLRDHYERIEDAPDILPFSKSTASKLRRIASAVRQGIVSRDELPPYTIAYPLVKLEQSAFEEAKRASLLRPDVRRAEVEDFLKNIRIEAEDGREADIRSRESVRRRIKTLTQRKAKLIAEVDLINQELSQLTASQDRSKA